MPLFTAALQLGFEHEMLVARMAPSGGALKYLTGPCLVMAGHCETTLPCSSQFPLTLPIRSMRSSDIYQSGSQS